MKRTKMPENMKQQTEGELLHKCRKREEAGANFLAVGGSVSLNILQSNNLGVKDMLLNSSLDLYMADHITAASISLFIC